MADAVVIDLTGFRERDLNARQREVLHRVQAGSDCGLCGDMGAWNPAQQLGVPCLACGREGEAHDA